MMKTFYGVWLLVAAVYAGEPSVIAEWRMPDTEWLELHANDPLPPLHQAAAAGQVDECRRLIAEGADVNMPAIPAQAPEEMGFGDTPLMLAAQNGHVEVCRHLLAAGADPECTTLYELASPLMLAAQAGHRDICHILLAAGANPETFGRTANRPLMLAARAGHVEVCRLLLAAGADVDATNRWDMSALNEASSPETPLSPEVRQQVVQLLQEAGANPSSPTEETRAPAHTPAVLPRWEDTPRLQPNMETLDSPSDEMRATVLIYHPAKHEILLHGDAAYRRKSPCSTFKIVSALLALENGVVTPQNSEKKWSGASYEFPEWNQDLNLETAFRHSCVWYFRQLTDELAQKLGTEGLRNALKQLHYGNADVSDFSGKLNTNTEDPSVSGFWLMSSLLISPLEQVAVMEHIFGAGSPFSPENLAALKRAMLVDEDTASGLRIYGKTGTGCVGPRASLGWFTGFVESAEGNVYFCICLENEGDDEVSGPFAKTQMLPLIKRYMSGELAPAK